jgi:glycerophosphoryl diester phosphodiesterase
MILSQWSQPLAHLRAVAEHRGDPALLTEFLTVKADPAPEDTAGSTMVAIYYRNVTPEAVTALHGQGFKVDCYTTNDSNWWDQLAAAGADWVITDDVVGYQKWAAART